MHYKLFFLLFFYHRCPNMAVQEAEDDDIMNDAYDDEDTSSCKVNSKLKTDSQKSFVIHSGYTLDGCALFKISDIFYSRNSISQCFRMHLS